MPDEVDVSENTLVLPNLESLYTEDLSFNLFRLFTKVLAPGPYRLTGNLYAKFSEGYIIPNGHTHAE